MIDLTRESIVLYHEMAMEQLRFFKANDQVSFHTGKAIRCLKVINKEILGE